MPANLRQYFAAAAADTSWAADCCSVELVSGLLGAFILPDAGLRSTGLSSRQPTTAEPSPLTSPAADLHIPVVTTLRPMRVAVVVLPTRGRPPEAAARRAGLEVVEKLLTSSIYAANMPGCGAALNASAACSPPAGVRAASDDG